MVDKVIEKARVKLQEKPVEKLVEEFANKESFEYKLTNNEETKINITEIDDECDFCSFEYGLSKQSVTEDCAGFDTGYMEYEIRPVTSDKYLYFVRYFNTNDNLVSKSSMFIKYCPKCGERLKDGMKGV